MAGSRIQPAPGIVFVRPLEELGVKPNTPSSGPPTEDLRHRELVLATIDAAGKDTGVKADQTALVRRYALEGADRFDDLYIVSGYDIAGTITTE